MRWAARQPEGGGALAGFRWDPERVGERSAPTTVSVTARAVAAFRQAVASHRAGEPVGPGEEAPPTFPICFQRLDVPGLELPLDGLIHTEQQLVYPTGRLLRVGDVVQVVGWLESVRQRGPLSIVVVMNQIRGGADDADEARVLVESRTTVMVTDREASA